MSPFTPVPQRLSRMMETSSLISMISWMVANRMGGSLILGSLHSLRHLAELRLGSRPRILMLLPRVLPYVVLQQLLPILESMLRCRLQTFRLRHLRLRSLQKCLWLVHVGHVHLLIQTIGKPTTHGVCSGLHGVKHLALVRMALGLHAAAFTASPAPPIAPGLLQ